MKKELNYQDQLKLYNSKYESGRSSLLILVILTIVNLVMMLTGSDSYFLFSAYLPRLIVIFAMILTGKMPEEWYDEPVEGFLPEGVLIGAAVIAVIIAAGYFVFWLLSKKRPAWLTVSLVCFCIDSAIFFFFEGLNTDYIIDYIIAAYVIYSLASAVSARKKLNALPPPPPVVEDSFEDLSANDFDYPTDSPAQEISENADENK